MSAESRSRPSARNAALVALQGEDRDVGGDDDEHREERGAADFDGGLEAWCACGGLCGRLQVPEPAEDVFDDDHRAIDDDAEVHRAQGEQVGGMPAQREAEEGGEQRKRNDGARRSAAARRLPRKRRARGHQHRARERLLNTVCSVVSISHCGRSTGTICTPWAGPYSFSVAIRSFSAVSTAEGFSPLRMSTMPVTMSSSSSCPDDALARRRAHTLPWRCP